MMEIGQRVHYFGTTGTIDSFEDYHREWAVVHWDFSGHTETVRSVILRDLTPEAAEILAPVQAPERKW